MQRGVTPQGPFLLVCLKAKELQAHTQFLEKESGTKSPYRHGHPLGSISWAPSPRTQSLQQPVALPSPYMEETRMGWGGAVKGR